MSAQSFSRHYVHVVWTTQDREPVLPPERDEWLRRCLLAIADRHRFSVGRVGIASDHVHAIVRLPRDRTLADVVQHIKGISAHDWNVQFARPRLHWQPRYWAESVSPHEVPALLDHIENQRSHHASIVCENWEMLDAR